MAVIGKAKAVAQIGRLKFGGFLAWLVWGGIHIAFLIGFRNRLQVLVQLVLELAAECARRPADHRRCASRHPQPPIG